MNTTNLLTQTESNTMISESLSCVVTDFHFHDEQIIDKGFWFVVPTELDAYKSAYYYQVKSTKITKQVGGGWLVSILGDK